MSNNTPLTVLGGITAEQFLNEYWQKKPLLIRNAMPEIIGTLEPKDVMELALEDHVTARLIRQKDKDPNQWHVKSSPLTKGDFQKLPKLWTLLVQAVDHYALDLAALWQKLHFIPQWRRDDIMVSYAPKGGSVGKHFDHYDVFLLQGHGQRRWQLGQMCDATTACVPDQPLRLLPEIDLNFDEVLNPGDLLYVPPGLAHYGVAENDCLTYSFGFRMPNQVDVLDRVGEHAAAYPELKIPLPDVARTVLQAAGQMQSSELDYVKNQIINTLQQSQVLDHAILALMSEAKYPENIPEAEEISIYDLRAILTEGYHVMLEPASRLIYREMNNGQDLQFWGNGELFGVAASLQPLLKQVADGEMIAFDEAFDDETILQDLLPLLSSSILMLVPPEL